MGICGSKPQGVLIEFTVKDYGKGIPATGTTFIVVTNTYRYTTALRGLFQILCKTYRFNNSGEFNGVAGEASTMHCEEYRGSTSREYCSGEYRGTFKVILPGKVTPAPIRRNSSENNTKICKQSEVDVG